MGHPVTTNPLIIMTINMTVVFIVLVALMVLINAIHYFDPTKPKAKPEPAAPAMAAAIRQAASAPEATTEPAPAEQGIPGEVIAVITAAMAAYGYGAQEIHAIRPVPRDGWKSSVRVQGSRLV